MGVGVGVWNGSRGAERTAPWAGQRAPPRAAEDTQPRHQVNANFPRVHSCILAAPCVIILSRCAVRVSAGNPPEIDHAVKQSHNRARARACGGTATVVRQSKTKGAAP